LGSPIPIYAQSNQPSSWGVVGTFVPRWEIPPSLEPVATLHFSEDDASIEELDLRGQEFRIGIARGRMLSGDWGVSFVRRTYADDDIQGSGGGGCEGGSVPGGATVLQCMDLRNNISRRDVLLNGLEVHKFIAFATIRQRVQIGLNIGGGFGTASGRIDTTSFEDRYTCTFPPGVVPPFADPSFEFGDDVDLCRGAIIGNLTTVQTGASSEDVSRLLKSESSKTLPIGRVEIAGAVLIGPQFKVRVAGGMNYPGTNAVSITGLYFFGGS
jgi:hypothetical protein